jgi:hypothetical protein
VGIAGAEKERNPFAARSGLSGELPLPSAPLPARAKAVSLARKPYPDRGLQGENHEWLPYLTDGEGRRCVGRDPMSIPASILTASGHPPRRTAQLVAAFAKGADGDALGLERVRGYGDIRQHCLRCVENAAEVRRCTTINCPFWPYRMGRNPHNPRRGRNPFAEVRLAHAILEAADQGNIEFIYGNGRDVTDERNGSLPLLIVDHSEEVLQAAD